MKKQNNLNDENYSLLTSFQDSKCKLQISNKNENEIKINQIEDGKTIIFKKNDIEKILERYEPDGEMFLQVNFKNKSKILITKQLIGFKPNENIMIRTAKVPKVVTTIDLNSVKKAIDDLLTQDEVEISEVEISILKNIYGAILRGAIDVGFEMDQEKSIYIGIMSNNKAATA